jgi:hypothetical protein
MNIPGARVVIHVLDWPLSRKTVHPLLFDLIIDSVLRTRLNAVIDGEQKLRKRDQGSSHTNPGVVGVRVRRSHEILDLPINMSGTHPCTAVTFQRPKNHIHKKRRPVPASSWRLIWRKIRMAC